jgi:hypothetical protein
MTCDLDPTASPRDPAAILEHFAELPDPRREHGRLHCLDEILFMAICAVLGGADSWQDIADFAESKFDRLGRPLRKHRSMRGIRTVLQRG